MEKHLPIYELCDVLKEKRRNREQSDACLSSLEIYLVILITIQVSSILASCAGGGAQSISKNNFHPPQAFPNQHPSLTREKLTSHLLTS